MKAIIIAILILVLSCVSVSAVPSVSITSIDFGPVDRGASASMTFTATNDGDVNLTDVIFDTDAPGKYAASVSPSTATTLNVGESKDYTLSLSIPSDEETGSHTIGDIVIDSFQYDADLEAIFVNPIGGLIFTAESVDVEVLYPPPFDRFEDTDDDAENVGDGQKADIDIYPRSEVTFIFFLENELKDNGDDDDNDIVDIQATITIKDIDDGDDLEEDSKEFDLKAENDRKLRISFTIPERVETGDYEVLIEVDGEIEDINQEFTITRTLKIPIRKESHDVNVVVNRVIPNEVSCMRNVQITGTILNLGNNEEDDAGISIKNAQLDLNYEKHDIELVVDPFDKDNEYQVQFPFEVDKDVPPGNYDIVFKAFRYGIELDSRVARLKVGACGDEKGEEVIEEPQETKEEETTSPVETSQEVVEPEQPKTQTPVISAPILEGTESQEKRYYETTKFKSLVIANILVLIVLVYLGAKFVVEKSS